jgi:hypothetical protein
VFLSNRASLYFLCRTTSTSLLDTIAETQITLNLFMNNKFDEAELRMKAM